MKRLTLYHGTDARTIKMSKEARKAYLEGCNQVIDTLFPLFGSVSPYKVADLGLEFYQILLMIQQRNNKSEFFQYNVLSLTNSYDRAVDYARHSFAGCELGAIAYFLIKQCETRFPGKLKQYDKINTACNSIIKIAEEEKQCPVIITINDVDPNFLVFESGVAIDDESIKTITEQTFETSFKYKKEIDLNQYEIKYLD